MIDHRDTIKVKGAMRWRGQMTQRLRASVRGQPRLFPVARALYQAARAARHPSSLWSSRQRLSYVVHLLYATARLRQRVGWRGRDRGRSRAIRRVVHISPSYFGDRSYVGGGERYVVCVAEAMAARVETRLVSFGPARETLRQGGLDMEIYAAPTLIDGSPLAPISYAFLRELLRADVVHCHQYRSPVSNLALVAGAALGKRVFVTDLGGSSPYNFADRLDLPRITDAALPISRFSGRMFPSFERMEVIHGGVGPRFLADAAAEAAEALPTTSEPCVLFVGRLLPHKGINYLIEAMEDDVPLRVIGRPYDERYLALLRQLAAPKRVEFTTAATDDDIIAAYRQATVTVLPSVYTDIYGSYQPAPDLLGLVMLESMARGTPVICTAVGGMPEFVEEGVTGFVVPPNDPAALRERITYLLHHPEVAREMGRTGRETVLERFTWDAVARHCLTAYQEC